ncbi:MAG: 2-dehydropantoate 2-reductase [Verrucomicrobiota bacterium]
MRIAVFGTGGVGGYFGGRLAQAGHDVVFVARGAHLKAIRAHGLRVDSKLGDFVVASAQATDDLSEVGEVDVVLLGVKAWQVPEAAVAMRPLVGPHTCVLPLQNGVEAAGHLVAELGPSHVLGGLCAIISFVAGPGHIRHVAGSEPFVTIGELDNRPSVRTSRLLEAFQGASVKSQIAPNIQIALWQKLILIVSLSSIGVITRTPAGIWRVVPETRRMYNDIVREAYAIARAHGIAVPEEHVQTVLKLPDGLEPEATTSLQRDIADGRPSELEEQIGVVVRTGREVGVEPNVLTFIYQSLLPSELRARGKAAIFETSV